MGVIYKIVDLLTNDFYIGSAVNFSGRKSTHLSQLRNNRHHSYKLQNTFYKSGEKNILFEIVKDNINDSELMKIEQYYLDTLKPSLNVSKYAVSGMDRVKDKVVSIDLLGNVTCYESSKEASEKTLVRTSYIRQMCNLKKRKLRGVNYVFRWKKHFDTHGMSDVSTEYINKNAREIIQLSNDKKIIGKYKSISCAISELKMDKSCYENIRRCCIGKTNSAYGYFWMFSDEKLNKSAKDLICKRKEIRLKNKINHKGKNNPSSSMKIIAISCETGKEYYFPSQKQAQRHLGVSQPNIFKVLKGEIKQCNGFYFKKQ